MAQALDQEERDTRTLPAAGAVPVVAEPEPVRHSRLNPLHWLHRLRRAWRRSLQLRTSIMVGVLTFVASGLLALFFAQQISDALVEARFEQIEVDANRSLAQVRDTFALAGTPETPLTDVMVSQTLRSLEGDSSTLGRRFMLEPLPDTDSADIGRVSSSQLDSESIPADLKSAVAAGTGVYYAHMAMKDEGGTVHPALAFGTQVILPPGSGYSLYLVYDLSDVQNSLDSVLRVLMLFGSGFVLLNVVVSAAVIRLVVQSVQQASLAAETLSRGNFEVRMPVHGEDEVARLGTSFNRMADNIQDQITQLAQLSQMQQRFVSDVSHELRTPLTTVRMAADVLYGSRDDFDPVNRRSTELLYHQVDRFQAMLADLLEITRFDAGAAMLALEETDLFALCNDVILTSQPLADRAGVEVFVVPQGSSFLARVDPRRIERIVRNLVNNAIEHAEGHPVDVVVSGDGEVVSVGVVDHGIGMSAEQVERVFDRFWRADPARTRTTGGSGLGLSIATEDTRIHGGSLAAWGELGVGSCFLLTVPCDQPPAGVPHSEETMVDHAALALPPVYDVRERRLASDPHRPLMDAGVDRPDPVGPDEDVDTGEIDRTQEQALRDTSREEDPR
ncbi:two-component sensor histidine kinase [Micrococcus sp. HMSC067E09]|uniref:MtrAB system histidine kinase MtrB n=1 Tax=Micrococcus sp. HMSC067E09 TaxID=1739367 RepID=UPI0008A1C1EF|nr:MtrAB system histidine kinase MtrB [Micrococcus sp. HMSC067E09]OFR87581.1 two-component sensor histidine kinase [Micrococcus sp. HMSC067E09]